MHIVYYESMRTTILFKPVTFQKVATIKAKTGKSLSDVVNDLIEQALHARKQPNYTKFKVKTQGLGVYPHLDYSKIHDLLDYAEGEDRKW